MIAATDNGIVLKSGPTITTLIESAPETEPADEIDDNDIAFDDDIIIEKDDLITFEE